MDLGRSSYKMYLAHHFKNCHHEICQTAFQQLRKRDVGSLHKTCMSSPKLQGQGTFFPSFLPCTLLFHLCAVALKRVTASFLKEKAKKEGLDWKLGGLSSILSYGTKLNYFERMQTLLVSSFVLAESALPCFIVPPKTVFPSLILIERPIRT